MEGVFFFTFWDSILDCCFRFPASLFGCFFFLLYCTSDQRLKLQCATSIVQTEKSYRKKHMPRETKTSIMLTTECMLL